MPQSTHKMIRFWLLALGSAVVAVLFLGCGELEGEEAKRCVRGAVECPCLTGNTCSADTDGTAMSCESGLCQRIECEPGLENCGCKSGLCAGALVCTDALGGVASCQDRTLCPRGTLGCDCYGDDSCDKDFDDSQLVCKSAVCQRHDCTQGGVGCVCLPGN